MPNFQIDVQGYLDSIPSAVFRPQDALRELVTNGLQSTALRNAYKRNNFSPRIDVEVPERLCLQVTDNGIGFDPQVLEKLGNLQLTKWPIAAKQLGLNSEEHKPHGIFGMGLTSTINICEELLIITKPINEYGLRYWWTNWKDGWQTWDNDSVVPNEIPSDVLMRAKRSSIEDVGARIILTLKDSAWRGPVPLDNRRLKELVTYYFSAVSTPIYVGAGRDPVNSGVKGWPMRDQQKRSAAIVSDWLDSRGFDLREAPETDYHSFPIEQADGISGVIWISNYRIGTVHFFSREVFGSDLRSLLPGRLGALSAIVNDDKAILDITKTSPRIATIEGARREEDIRNAVSNSVIDYFVWLNDEYDTGGNDRKQSIESIGKRFGRQFLGYLLSSSTTRTTRTIRIAEKLLQWIPLPLITPKGSKTLPSCEIQSRNGMGSTIYYADNKTDLSHLQLFPQEIIVDATGPNDEFILEIYEQANSERNVSIELVEDPTIGLISAIESDELNQGGWGPLIEEIRVQWRAGLVSLADVNPALGEAFAHIQRGRHGSSESTLIVNRNNVAMRRLRMLKDESLKAAAGHVVELSKLLESKQLTGEEFAAVSRNFDILVESLCTIQDN